MSTPIERLRNFLRVSAPWPAETEVGDGPYQPLGGLNLGDLRGFERALTSYESIEAAAYQRGRSDEREEHDAAVLAAARKVTTERLRARADEEHVHRGWDE